MEVQIKDIIIGERMRKNFDGIELLAASIAAHGLIEPIVLDENNLLISGERRIKALLMIKKTSVDAVFMKDLSPLQKKEIELEENIQRANFGWQEEVNAKLELHRLKQRIHGAAISGQSDNTDKWAITNTAEALGESRGTINQDLQLAKGIAAFPELLKEKSKTTAFKILKQKQLQILNAEVAKRIRGSEAVENPSLINGDCIEGMQKLGDNSIDLIVTDPPYGIDVGNAHTYKRMTMTDVTFSDGEFDTFDFLDKAFKEMYRILKGGCHMYVFFGIDKYEVITKILRKHGFIVHNMPLIWDKGSGSYPSQMTTFVHSYEPFLHCWKGQGRKLNGTPRDVFPIKRVPAGQKIHPTQKPTELLRDLVELSSTVGDLVLDPFAGSAATIIAAKECQRRALGFELNPVYHKNACDRLAGKAVETIGTEEGELDSDNDIVLEDCE